MPAVKSKKSAQKTRQGKRTRSGYRPGAYLRGLLTRLGTVGTVCAGGAGLVLILVLVAGGYVGAAFHATGTSAQRAIADAMIDAGYKIKTVSVVGRVQSSPQAISSALGPVFGTSLLHFDPHHARARIEELGWVRSASVSRLWPDQITVSIRERKPAAVWQISGSLRLVDAQGAIIRDVGAYEYSGLPLIVGAGAPEAAAELLRALDRTPVFNQRIGALIRVSDRRWNLRFNTDLDVKLPETGVEAAIHDLAVLQETVNVLDQDFEYIDLRDPERLVFRCRDSGLEVRSPVDLLAAGFSCR